MKIYLANSLTLAPEEFKQGMLDFREKLKIGHEIFEYLGTTEGSALDVFTHDIQCVKDCDMVLAEVSYPSTGVGIEIVTALQAGKKVLAFAKQEAKVSRMVLGMNFPNYKFIRYSSLGEILKYI